MPKVPVIDLSNCNRCGVCVEVAPQVFRFNSSGYVEIQPLSSYPETEVKDAIKNCPEQCIDWSP